MKFSVRIFLVSVVCVIAPTTVYSYQTTSVPRDNELDYRNIGPASDQLTISRSQYLEKLHGFWLGQSIANWTGLITENRRTDYPFYTDFDWSDRYQILYRDEDVFYTDFISYMFVEEGGIWGADDDTDIEYMYQHLIDKNNSSILTGEQIRSGWLDHIRSDDYQDMYLWVSNENAYYLMK